MEFFEIDETFIGKAVSTSKFGKGKPIQATDNYKIIVDYRSGLGHVDQYDGQPGEYSITNEYGSERTGITHDASEATRDRWAKFANTFCGPRK